MTELCSEYLGAMMTSYPARWRLSPGFLIPSPRRGKRWLPAPGVKVIRFHDARHTHASLWLKLGIHPKIVQERLGHSTLAIILDTYSHVAPGLQEAAAMRFDELLTPKYEDEVVAEVG